MPPPPIYTHILAWTIEIGSGHVARIEYVEKVYIVGGKILNGSDHSGDLGGDGG
jgi:hypothetical protein